MNEKRQQSLLIYRKGIQLFGKRVANTLENMGELETVVSQYESTKGGKEWANMVTTRTEKFLDGMLNSENEAQKKTALRLLKRGSYLGGASEGEKSDFLNELSATGVLEEEDLLDFNLEGPGVSTYTGAVPDLGEFDVLTANNLREVATTLAGSIIPGARIERTDEGVKIITPDGISPSLVRGIELEIQDQIETNQYQVGPVEAQKIVLQDFAKNYEKKAKEIAEMYNVPVPPPPGSVSDAGTTNATSMEVQEAMGDTAIPEVTPPSVPVWNDGVFNE